MGPGLGPYFRVDLPEKTRKNPRLTRNRLAKAVGELRGLKMAGVVAQV